MRLPSLSPIVRLEPDLVPEAGEVRPQGSAPASGSEDGDRGPWLGRGSWHEWTPARKRGSSTSNARGLRAGRWIGVGGRHGLVLGLALLLALGETRDRRDALPFLEVDQAHTLRVAANHADLVDPQADHLPTARDQHDLIVIRHHANADHAPGLVGGLHGDDALAAAPRETVLVHLGPLAVAVLGHGQKRRTRLDQIDGDELVALVELHAPHAVRVAAHRTSLDLFEADRLAEARGE